MSDLKASPAINVHQIMQFLFSPKISESIGMEVFIVNAALRNAGWLFESIEPLANCKEVKDNIYKMEADQRWKITKFTWNWEKYKLESHFDKTRV